MKTTCCPQYVIRMDVVSFRLSKSQKSSIKKFKRYLLEGKTPTVDTSSKEDLADTPVDDCVPIASTSMTTTVESCSNSKRSDKVKKNIKPGVGPDPNKPPCKKARLIRKERREKKLLERAKLQPTIETPSLVASYSHQGNEDHKHSTTELVAGNCGHSKDYCKQQITTETSSSNSQGGRNNECKQKKEFSQYLEEILTFPEEECVHKFTTKLVRIDSQEFTDSYEESFQVFKKFQMGIHKESEADSGEKQFNEFLVYTPLRLQEGSEEMTTGYGTYHQQYLLDGKIFAVGVLDILPKGVVCEYLYYDPDYRFITPGVITALLEILMVQQFCLQNPQMQHYYMGFYVQSCPKMNYKSRYSASELLCPETYTYISLEKCIPKLKASAYSRLAEDDWENPHSCFTQHEMCVPVLADNTLMSYTTYKTLYGNHADNLIKEYIELISMDIAINMAVYLGRR